MRTDDYNLAGIGKKLTTKWVGSRLSFYESIDSTNLLAWQEAGKGAPHGTLIVADLQTSGRGRRGRNWESPAGVNIYFSLLLRPELVQDRASMLTITMAHSVSKAIVRMAGLDCKIKWPNDIVVNGKKVCGILTEMGFNKDGGYYVVVGVGINVRSQHFASELADKATSLEDEDGRLQKLSRSHLLAEIMDAFEEDYDSLMACQDLTGIIESYNNMLINRNARVRVLDPKGEYEGEACGITKTGELLVKTADGTVVQVYAGEVSVRGIYGYV